MPSSRKAAMAAIATAVITVMAACNGSTVYDRYKPVNEWERADTACFNVQQAASAGTFGLEVNLRTNGNYPFMGITVIVDHTVIPTDTAAHRQQTAHSDTLNCKLTDDKGKPTGSGLSNFQYSFHVADVSLHKGDSLAVKVRHNMKRETLPGIEDIGIKLTKK